MNLNSQTDGAATIVVRVDRDIKDLIPEFLENKERDVNAIAAALTQQDYETIRVLGHGMKGSGGGYGFDMITEIGAALEQAALNGQDQDIRKWIDELEDYLGRVQVVYE